jgi:hypothetical protein
MIRAFFDKLSLWGIRWLIYLASIAVLATCAWEYF